MIDMEVLAPAGSNESLQAAVRSGADAVYLGASSFNARRNATNFDALSLSDAVKYCHGRKVKVYVTLNTLIFDSEKEKFLSCLEEVLDAGPDSVIVQDLGVLKLIRSVCPDIPVCASTQMAICNAEGAHALEELGIKQAVLARELSLAEIENIHSQTDIRLEAFIHGAHCMSVSGLCYFSSALGERSGNRGLCAQPCRLDFRCKGREYALSLKDLSLVTHIRELQNAGVSSLKIEGRMKRPEYVAAAVTAVKAALNGENPNMEDLRKVFSRSGFTDGYFVAKRNAKMFGVRSTEDISASKEILGRMASLYRHELSSVPINMTLTVNKDITSLSVSDGTNTVKKDVDTVTADTGALTEEIAERSLKKTGNTPYYPNAVKVNLEADLPVPSSSINALKKAALDELLQKGSKGIQYKRQKAEEETFSRNEICEMRYRARFEKTVQVVSPERFDLVILPLDEIMDAPFLIERMPNLCAEIPTVIWPGNEQRIFEKLALLYGKGLTNVTAGNLGHILPLKKMGFSVHGDSTLNITNSSALKQYEKFGLSDAVLSPELTIKQAESVFSGIPKGMYIYGRLPLMFFRSCPSRTNLGCEKCSGRSEVTDRMHTSFPVICHQKQYSVMHNSVPLYLGDMTRPRMDFGEIYFTVESQDEIIKVLNDIDNSAKYSSPFTRGHSFNPVR